jgi:hypothetical protein
MSVAHVSSLSTHLACLVSSGLIWNFGHCYMSQACCMTLCVVLHLYLYMFLFLYLQRQPQFGDDVPAAGAEAGAPTQRAPHPRQP